MHRLPEYRRILLLTEGRLGVFTSKTAASLLRYRPGDIAAVIDSAAAGRELRAYVPWAPAVPILASVPEALDRAAGPEKTAGPGAGPLESGGRPDALFIGVAPVGGALPEEMRPHVCAALAAGLAVVSGLHAFLADDPDLVARAARTGARLLDLRRPPAAGRDAGPTVASMRALTTRCRRILTVGTDCNVGKMVAALELTAAARAAGRNARFLATGQTGMMIASAGIAIDACVADFAAGAVEQLVLSAADSDICFIEGQGSLAHPGFSAVTLALLHGACPDALVLVHQAGRTHYKAPPYGPLPALPQLIAAYEQMAAFLHPARVAAIALNTFGLTDAQAGAAAEKIEAQTGLPTADPVRDGCARLLAAVDAAEREERGPD